MKVIHQQPQVDWKTVAKRYEREYIEIKRQNRMLKIKSSQRKVYEEDSQQMHRFDNFKSPFSWK